MTALCPGELRQASKAPSGVELPPRAISPRSRSAERPNPGRPADGTLARAASAGRRHSKRSAVIGSTSVARRAGT